MLYKKSSDYIRRALESKKADDISMYWLLSSVALELLGKAVLADRHPFLVVNPRGPRDTGRYSSRQAQKPQQRCEQ